MAWALRQTIVAFRFDIYAMLRSMSCWPHISLKMIGVFHLPSHRGANEVLQIVQGSMRSIDFRQCAILQFLSLVCMLHHHIIVHFWKYRGQLHRFWRFSILYKICNSASNTSSFDYMQFSHIYITLKSLSPQRTSANYAPDRSMDWCVPSTCYIQTYRQRIIYRRDSVCATAIVPCTLLLQSVEMVLDISVFCTC